MTRDAVFGVMLAVVTSVSGTTAYQVWAVNTPDIRENKTLQEKLYEDLSYIKGRVDNIYDKVRN